MKIDMHFHSTHSDGYSTQEELIEEAEKQGLDFIALTDHDSVSYWFRENLKSTKIQSCQSVEISANNAQHNKRLHLPLYAREISEKTNEVLQNIPKSNTLLIKKQIIALNQIGFRINLHEFYYFSCSGWRKVSSLNKYDLARFIFSSDFNREIAIKLNGSDITEEMFYQKFFKKWGQMYDTFSVKIKDYDLTLEVCKTFKEESNWVLSIAHPNVTFKKWGIEEFQSVLPHYIEIGGINAIEINSEATKEWVMAILEAKSKYGLYITFWSDNHKIWHSDNNHWNFWKVNPHINNPALISSLFNEYRDLIT